MSGPLRHDPDCCRGDFSDGMIRHSEECRRPVNQNDCQKCGGWGCPVCTLKGVGEQADPELDELSRLRARVRHLEERLAVEKTSAEAWVALGAADEREALISLIQNAGERQWGGWDPGLIAAIRARGGKALNRLEGVK